MTNSPLCLLLGSIQLIGDNCWHFSERKCLLQINHALKHDILLPKSWRPQLKKQKQFKLHFLDLHTPPPPLISSFKFYLIGPFGQFICDHANNEEILHVYSMSLKKVFLFSQEMFYRSTDIPLRREKGKEREEGNYLSHFHAWLCFLGSDREKGGGRPGVGTKKRGLRCQELWKWTFLLF